MHPFRFIVHAAFLLALGNPASAQPSFLPASLNTGLDDFLADYGTINPNRLVFAAAQANTAASSPEWSDGLVFITDEAGTVVRQRTFPHAGTLYSTQPVKIFCTPTTIELFSIEGPVSTTCSVQVSNTIRWVRMDTALNILSQRVIQVTSGSAYFSTQNAVERLDGYTYFACMRYDTCAGLGDSQPFLLRLDAAANLVGYRVMDASFYGSTLPVRSAHLSGISAHAPSHTLWMTGIVRIDSAHVPFGAGAGHFAILHKLDTVGNLVDTFRYADVAITPATTIDTTATGYLGDVLPLDSSRVWIGSAFQFWNVPAGISFNRIGLSLYTSSTGKHRRKFFAPREDTTEFGAGNAWVKSIAAAPAAGTVYALGTSRSQGSFGSFDTKLVVVKYDTAGNLLWYRFLGDAGAFHAANGIYTDGDTAVTITATRYNYVGGSLQREFYVLRLRASDGVPTAVFSLPVANEAAKPNVFPNPATDALHIRLPRSSSGAVVSLYSATGALLSEATFDGVETTLSVKDFMPGLYFYRVRSNGNVSSGQFAKQ